MTTPRFTPLLATVLVVLTGACLLIATAPTGQAQGVEWWDEDRPFRVLVNDQGPVTLPNGGQGQPTSLMGYHLDFQEALDRANWPTAIDLPPDPESIAIVPYERLSDGAPPEDPIPRTVLDPLWEQGTCDPSPQAACLVAWESHPTARAYGIYWAPHGWDVDRVQPGLAPTLTGHGQGHEHWIVGNGFPSIRALVQPQTAPTLIERLGPSGWQAIDPTCTPTLGCGLQPQVHRLLTQQPSRVTVYQNTDDPVKPRALALTGPLGAWGTNLGLPLPGSSMEDSFQVGLWPRTDACQPRCDITVNGQQQSLRVDNANRFPVAGSTAVMSPEDIHGAIQGDGLAPVTPRDAYGRDFILPVHDRFTVVATTSTTLSIANVRTGEMIQSSFQVNPGVTIAPVDQEHNLLRVQANDPVTLFQGSAQDAEVKHHQPLTNLTNALVPAQSNVHLVAPLASTGGQSANLLTPQGDIASTLNIPSGGITLVAQGDEDPHHQPVDTNATLGALTVNPASDDDPNPLLGQALTFTYPQRLEPLTADYQAEIVDLAIDPPSQFAGAGETVTFDVDVTNLAQGPGTQGGLSVAMDLEPVGRTAEMDITATLGTTTVHLPDEHGATETVPLHVRVPDDASDTVLTLKVTAHAEDAPELAAEENARVSVVTIRDFDLSYMDGSTSRTEMLQPGGQTSFTVEAENTGTVEIDLLIQDDTLGDEDFHTCIRSPEGGQCVPETTLTGLEPGQTRTFDVTVEAPDREDEGRVDVTIRGEISSGQGPVRSVDATVLLNVPVAATFSVPDDLLLAPGENATFDIDIENLGVQADAQLEAITLEGPVQGWIQDEEDEPVTTAETLLGPIGTDRASWTKTALVTVSEEDATPGLTREVRFLLELEPGGGLPPYRDTISVPVNVIRVMDPFEANHTLSPGTPTEIEEPLAHPDLAGATLRASVQDAPAGWDVQTPPEATFDDEGRGSLTLTITPPSGQDPTTGTVTIALEDPMGPGTSLTVTSEVPREAVAAIDIQDEIRVALGDEATLPAVVQNVGNQPLEGGLDVTASGLNVTTTPLDIALEPGEEETIAVHLQAMTPLEQDVDVAFMDGDRIAGTTSLNVTAQRAQLALLSATAPPTEGRLLVTANVENQGDIPVHGLNVSLYHGDEKVQTRTIERLVPGQPVPVPIEWTPEEGIDFENLEVRLDPEGAFLGNEAPNDGHRAHVELEDEDAIPAPFLPLLVTTAAVALFKKRGRARECPQRR